MKEVQRVFNEPPDVFVKVTERGIQYEVMIYAPFVNNVGRGTSLAAAVEHLKRTNHKESA